MFVIITLWGNFHDIGLSLLRKVSSLTIDLSAK